MVDPAILFQNLSYRIQGKDVLSSIDLRIEEGEKVALLGPNGSGKSSLIRVIRGEARPWSGDMSTDCRLFGRRRWNLFDLRSMMGVVSPEIERGISPRTKTWDLVASGLFQSYDLYRCHKLQDADVTRVDHTVGSLGIDALSSRPVSSLSTGEMRRALIARALVNDPRLLVLDEPMTGLDIIARKEFRDAMSSLASKGKGIIIATHDLEDIIPEIERVILLKDGRIFSDGEKDDVLNDSNLSDLFGVEVHVLRSGRNYHASVP